METKQITKTLISENKRPEALPFYFGKQFLEFEMGVYGLMDRFCEGYNGGYWDFYSLSNGGFLMCLDGEQQFKVSNPANYFKAKMSGEAVCVGVNLYAVNALLWDGNAAASMVDLYEHLMGYVYQMPHESEKIFAFID